MLFYLDITKCSLIVGARKRGATKRSPLGWRMFFSKSRNNSQNNLVKNRKASTPITINVSRQEELKNVFKCVIFLSKVFAVNTSSNKKKLLY